MIKDIKVIQIEVPRKPPRPDFKSPLNYYLSALRCLNHLHFERGELPVAIVAGLKQLLSHDDSDFKDFTLAMQSDGVEFPQGQQVAKSPLQAPRTVILPERLGRIQDALLPNPQVKLGAFD